MGIEHEKIHLETTSCLIRQLPLRCLKTTELGASLFINRELSTSRTLEDALKITNTWVEVPATEVKIGRVHTGFQKRKEHAVPYYGWDNEFGTHTAKVEGFKVSDKLISNAQFYEFALDNGYESKELWSEEGWRWSSGTKSKWPKFWVNRSENQTLEASNFTLRLTLSETETLPWDFPVEINCFEANAYCRWLSRKMGKAIRLPTEDEYYSTLKHIKYDHKKDSSNIGLVHASPSPVD